MRPNDRINAPHPLSLDNLDIDFRIYPSWIPVYPHNSLAQAMQVLGHADAALSAVEDDCDVVIIDSLGDFGLDIIRSIISIPVLGSGELALREASRDNRSFGIITVWPTSMNFILADRLVAANCGSLCVGITNIEQQSFDGLAELQDCRVEPRDDHHYLVEHLASGVIRLAENGAQAVVLGGICMFGLAEAVSTVAQLPVIDPFRVALDAARNTQPLEQRPAIHPSYERVLRAMIDAVAHDGIGSSQKYF